MLSRAFARRLTTSTTAWRAEAASGTVERRSAGHHHFSFLARHGCHWWTSREAAEKVLARVIADEPDLADVLYVESVELEQAQN
jgi:hypothetical protein